MKAFLRKIRFQLGRPGGYVGDGPRIGLALGTAMRSYASAEGVERQLERWARAERAANGSGARRGSRR